MENSKKPYRPPTEAETWAMYGCSSNEEWHGRMKQNIEREYTPEEVNGCYVGTLKPIKEREYEG